MPHSGLRSNQIISCESFSTNTPKLFGPPDGIIFYKDDKKYNHIQYLVSFVHLLLIVHSPSIMRIHIQLLHFIIILLIIISSIVVSIIIITAFFIEELSSSSGYPTQWTLEALQGPLNFCQAQSQLQLQEGGQAGMQAGRQIGKQISRLVRRDCRQTDWKAVWQFGTSTGNQVGRLAGQQVSRMMEV